MARNHIRNAGGQGPANAAAKSARIPSTTDNPNPTIGTTIVQRADDPTGEGKLTPSPMQGGGSYGVIPEAERRVMFHNLVSSGGLTSGGLGKRPKERKPRTFVVTGPVGVNGRISFVYDNQRVNVVPGKMVTETTYDLDLLRRQGLRLEEVIDPLGDAQEESLAVVEDEPEPKDDSDSDDKDHEETDE